MCKRLADGNPQKVDAGVAAHTRRCVDMVRKWRTPVTARLTLEKLDRVSSNAVTQVECSATKFDTVLMGD